MIFIDQLHRKIEITAPPKRIISLVPSQTELLYDLGLRDEVVGITKFCIHPQEWYRSKERIGGTKKYDFEKIKNLQPDLIIGNKEENEQSQIEELMKHYPVWMSDINTLNDALGMIASLGALLHKNETATNIKLAIESSFHSFTQQQKQQLKVAYFIWRAPYMVAGHDTFINEMLHRCGLENVFTNKISRYPEVSMEELIEASPELIFLSSEPYPFKEKHIQEFRAQLPQAKIIIVDGELFSWYGSRLLKSATYFKELIG
jgi:ABC-type Fe3+-hydroxamate transport system substrate-binding protein